jgi:UDP-N-acetylglucosamine acyltransferase
MTVDGTPAHVVGLNKVGLRRAGMEPAAIQQLKDAYRLIYRRGLRWTEVLTALKSDFPAEPAAALLQFFQGSKRGFTPERRTPKAAMLRLVNAAEDTDQRQTEAA